jgi:hypothetical protein
MEEWMITRRFILALVFAAAGFATASTGYAEPSEWYSAGSALVGDDGTWNFSGRVQPVNLATEGLTYLRVTSGPCDGSTNTYYVYEVNLSPPAAGDDAWFGMLQPVGRRAMALPENTPNPNAILIPRSGLTSSVTIILPDQHPALTMTACFGRPS